MKWIFQSTLFFLCIMLIFACSEDNEITNQDSVPVLTHNSQSRNTNPDPFYDLIYLYDSLNIITDRRGTYPFIDEVISDLQNRDSTNSLMLYLKQQNIYPCWNCAEPEYLDIHNYYIPFYEISTSRLDGLLIAQEVNNTKQYRYLTRNMVTQIVSLFTEPYSAYWHGIMNYFDLDNFPEGRDDVFASGKMPCLWFGAVCGCPDITPQGQLSHTYCNLDDPINNPDCDAGYCRGSNNGGGTHGQEDLPFHLIDDWVSFDGDESSGGLPGGTNSNPTGGNNGGNNNNNNNTPRPPWDDFCGSFNGSLGTASNSGGLNEDGTIDIPLYENPADLYKEQVQRFINQYGLGAHYTAKELMELVGEDCAVSYAPDVKACLKCHFISPLGHSDNMNWDLFEDFDVIADCLDNSNPDCIDCQISFKSFTQQFGYQFSEEEKNHLFSNFNCSNYEIFSNEALSALVSSTSDEENPFICKSSFDNYTPTGSGATIEMHCNKIIDVYFQFIDDPVYSEICYDAPDLCITTGSFELDEDGEIITDHNGNTVPLGMNTRKQLTADAYSAARYAVHHENENRLLNGLPFLSSNEAATLFQNSLTQELEKRMTGVSVSSGSCSGSIGTGRPKFDIFGICLPSICKC